MDIWLIIDAPNLYVALFRNKDDSIAPRSKIKAKPNFAILTPVKFTGRGGQNISHFYQVSWRGAAGPSGRGIRMDWLSSEPPKHLSTEPTGRRVALERRSCHGGSSITKQRYITRHKPILFLDSSDQRKTTAEPVISMDKWQWMKWPVQSPTMSKSMSVITHMQIDSYLKSSKLNTLNKPFSCLTLA